MSDLTTREIRSRAAPPEGMVAVASRSHGSAGTDAFLGQYKIQRRTAAGSSLKFCLVAKGEADIYPRVGRTCEWDTAAGQAILQSAGGSVTRLDGEPMLYGNSAARFCNPDYVAWGRGPVPPQH
jgi:3'(2'), 5'-bisphosphate nucleotidase